jgi:4-hydroxybenzoyl-CoA thioesterase
MAFSHLQDITVAWGDCAPSRAVFYPNYFRWFDRAVWELFEAAGRPLEALEAEYGIVGLPLVDTQASFVAPCRLGDRLTMETAPVEWQRKTVVIGHTLRRGETVCVRGREVRFWGVRHPDDPARLKAAEIPRAVIAHFATLG